MLLMIKVIHCNGCCLKCPYQENTWPVMKISWPRRTMDYGHLVSSYFRRQWNKSFSVHTLGPVGCVLALAKVLCLPPDSFASENDKKRIQAVDIWPKESTRNVMWVQRQKPITQVQSKRQSVP